MKCDGRGNIWVTGPGGVWVFSPQAEHLGVVEILQNNVWRIAGKLPFTRDTHTQGSTPAVHQMAVDPREPGTLYASTNDGLWDQDLFVSLRS